MNHTDALVQRRNRAFGPGAPLFYDTPLHIVRGQGAYLFDSEGRRYVDMYNNVPCVGHAHPVVAEAIARQAATLNVHSRYLHEGAIELAERLSALHGPQIESVLFTCSATEANEVAIRMARMATGHEGVICTNAAYHGNTTLVSSLTYVGSSRPETDTIGSFPFPEKFRPIAPGLDEDALRAAYLNALDATIQRFQKSGKGVAALLVCSIFANEGLPDVPKGFMAAASERIRAAGGLVISDEVQAGYGRTGSWWGYDITEFVPDIVVTGKPMGNGVPLAATASSESLMANFRGKTRYFNTYAASPLQAAAGLAVLDVITRENLISHAGKVGGWLKAEMQRRASASPVIGDVRGVGLFIGVDIVTPGSLTPDANRAAWICDRLKDAGFLTSNAGLHRNIVKIRPPLVFGLEEAEAFLGAWDAVVADIHV